MIPTILELLPDIKDKKIIDIGCGNGILIPHLLKRSPSLVVGTDIAGELLNAARQRLPDSVKLYDNDVTKPAKLAEAPFDGAICNFVLNAVGDISSAFNNIQRSLCKNAFLIVGVTHPFFAFGRHIMGDPLVKGFKGYFKSIKFQDGYFEKGNTIEFEPYTHSISAYINAAICAGFRIEKILEPETPQDVVAENPEFYEKCKQLPVSIYLLMKKN